MQIAEFHRLFPVRTLEHMLHGGTNAAQKWHFERE